jgi:hypothetical protein
LFAFHLGDSFFELGCLRLELLHLAEAPLEDVVETLHLVFLAISDALEAHIRLRGA